MKKLFTFLFLLSVITSFSQVKPNLTNTGTTGTLTAYTGTTTITTDNFILENAIISGSLNIKAHNVTIKNCLIETGTIMEYVVTKKILTAMQYIRG